ncbi:MAG: hypothetical protein EZS28_032572 [Streblomastix strix]|uniref:Uncharacterized protein n=1 Tax=Streblomastix strix TaxID=222440 RepID=A0A5J4UP90_9EUKA|nr:MAG: hypothetical protein EZS28_032572 [Streblomastix strix]
MDSVVRYSLLLAIDGQKREIVDINCQQCINIPQTPALIELKSAIGTHLSQENDQQTLALRSGSIKCLWYIQFWGDVSTHSELINVGYARVLVIAISTASGSGEEQDIEIWNGLSYLSEFIRCLNKEKQNSFPPQPLLAHRSDEQLEEEGGKEEIDSQLINNGHQYCNIKDQANQAKGAILNYFIEQGTS